MYSSPDTPDRHRLQPAVEHVDLRVPDRPADRHARPPVVGAGPARHVDRRLGRTVEVVQLNRGRACAEPVAQLRRQRLAAADHPPQLASRVSQRLGAPLPCSRKACSIDGTKCSVVTPLAADRLDEVRRIPVPAGRRHHQPGAGEQRPEELPHRDVEAERRLLQHRVVARQPDTRPASRAGGCRPRCVFTAPFGRPGRARGVDHVGEIVGMQIASGGALADAGRCRSPDASSSSRMRVTAVLQRQRRRRRALRQQHRQRRHPPA